MTALLFMDTETLGLGSAPMWDWACIRRNADGTEERYEALVQHDRIRNVITGERWIDTLPDEFKEDYLARFRHQDALGRRDFQAMVELAARKDPDGHRPHVVGAVPSFDTQRLEKMFGWELHSGTYYAPAPWHYHIIDVENEAHGYLVARGDIDPGTTEWKSDDLARMLDVEPELYRRHTAMGDCEWTLAQWDAMADLVPAVDELTYYVGVTDLASDFVSIFTEARRGEIPWRKVPAELRDWWTGFEA